MHSALLARFIWWFEGTSKPKYGLSRSHGKLNIGRSTWKQFAVFGTACLLLFVTLRFHAQYFSLPVQLRNRDAGDKGEAHGPLRVSGELSVSEVVRYQQASAGPGFECPHRQNKPVFLALSTIPSRRLNLPLVITKLLNQTFPTHVLLSIPDTYARFPSSQVKELNAVVNSDSISGNDRVHVLRGPMDAGPATKLLFPLSRLEGFQATILVVDDDQDYSPTLACDLLSVSNDYPKTAITRRSRVYPRKHCSGYLESSLIAEETVATNQPRIYHGSDLVMGTSGYLVQTSFFGRSVFDFEACPASIQSTMRHNDDIWISGHLKRQQVDILVALSGYKHGLPNGTYYRTRPAETRRKFSGRDGLWASRAEIQRRSRALHGFFGMFCVPTRISWQDQQAVCSFSS